jgi:hypothetical protein
MTQDLHKRKQNVKLVQWMLTQKQEETSSPIYADLFKTSCSKYTRYSSITIGERTSNKTTKHSVKMQRFTCLKNAHAQLLKTRTTMLLDVRVSQQ